MTSWAEALLILKLELMHIRKQIFNIDISKNKMKESQASGQMALEKQRQTYTQERSALEVNTTTDSETEDQKQKIINDYLESLGKMGDQLSNERERQLKNLNKKFDVKSEVLNERKNSFQEKYRLKFRVFLQRIEALALMQNESLNQSDNLQKLKSAFTWDHAKNLDSEDAIELEDILVKQADGGVEVQL